MWWKAYGDTQPKFVKAWNSKKKRDREPLTDEVERMAWNYHYTYLYSQMIYEWSEGFGKLEVITKEYSPTGCWLPKIIETDKNKPINPDILKQRFEIDRQNYMTAPVDLFSNPFFPAVFLPERKDPALVSREAEERLKNFKVKKEVSDHPMQLSLF
jgi:hypothetical protein